MSDENREELEVGTENQELEPEEFLPDYEAEAADDGWVPKEEYRGDPENWVDAETFVKRGKQINKILRSNNERLKAEIAEMKRQHKGEMDKVHGTITRFKKFYDSVEERAYKQALSDLKAQKRDALENGQHDMVVEIDDQISELSDSRKQAKAEFDAEEVSEQMQAQPEETPTVDPEFAAWHSKNSWYGSDPETTAYAEALGRSYSSEGIIGVQLLRKVESEVKRRFPDKFSNPRRNGPNAVEGGGPRGRQNKKQHTYDNLPADAKAACDEFIAMGMIKDKEEYVKNYDWE